MLLQKRWNELGAEATEDMRETVRLLNQCFGSKDNEYKADVKAENDDYKVLFGESQ